MNDLPKNNLNKTKNTSVSAQTNGSDQTDGLNQTNGLKHIQPPPFGRVGVGDRSLSSYVLSHSDPEGDYLYRLGRAANVHLLHGRMASGHLQGIGDSNPGQLD